MRQLSRDIKRVALVPAVGFAVLCLHLGYWQVLRAPELRADEYNSRAEDRLRATEPGRMYDSDSELLLGARKTPRGWERTYPAGEHACHLTGYNTRSGLQRGLRDAFLNVGRYEKPWAEFVEGPLQGNDVVLTVDLDAQKLATRLLRGRRGAVVALGAHTGAVLTLVSAPAYDPESILESSWDFRLFQEDPNKPEYNRALLGLYPPGSVLKVLTAAAVLDLNRVNRDTQFECTGELEINGAEIHCPRAHGTVTLDEALQVSCNTTFARMAEYLLGEELLDYARRLALTEPASLPMPSRSGSLGDIADKGEKVLLAETAFGQGRAQVTPFGIARMTLAIANQGQVLEPYVVERVVSPAGRTVAQAQARELGRAVSAETAQTLAGMMANVVEQGTGTVAQIRGVTVAGKTGSAENPDGAAHSWFTGFAPVDRPQVVVAVVVENAGAGSEAAAPIAREVMAHLLHRAGVR